MKDREVWRAAAHRWQRVGHDLATEQQQYWLLSLCFYPASPSYHTNPPALVLEQTLGTTLPLEVLSINEWWKVQSNPLPTCRLPGSSIALLPWTDHIRSSMTWRSNVKHDEVHHVSVQFSCSVVSDSLRPHELQHARPPCPSPAPGVYPNSCPSPSWWCHPTISSSVVPFSSCLQSFPARGFFQKSQFFALGGQSIGVSTSTSVLPMNTQVWSLGWTGWISLQSKGLSRVFSNTTVQKHHSSVLSFLHSPTLTSIHDH